VVPSQRAPEASTPAPAGPTGQIGGRAMLRPGESLTGRVAATRSEEGPSAQSAAPDGAPVEAAGPPTGAFAAPAAGSAGLPGTAESPEVGQRWVEPGARPWTAKPAGRVVAARGTPVSRALAGVRGGGASAVAKVRNWPRGLQIAAGAGLVVALLLGSVALLNRPDTAGRTPQQAGPQPTASAGPSFETETFAERGVSVNVPAGWTRKNGTLYVDFVDPDDGGRKVRVIVEEMNVNPRRWVEIAENGLKARRTSCAEPYNQVAVRNVEVAGRPGAEFEYTCGSGDQMRHGVWRMVPHDGKAYSFYLSATDAHFAESKAIFDEMAHTFRLTGTS
jgi:eukaryotic-like serine/threonine-protein kinase